MQQQDFHYEFECQYDRGVLLFYRFLIYKKHGDSIIGWYRNDDHISSDDHCFCAYLANEELHISFQNTEADFEDGDLREELVKIRHNFSALSAHEQTPMSLFNWLEYELYLQGNLQSVPYNAMYEYQNELETLSPALRDEFELMFEADRYDELYPIFRRLKFQSLLEELNSRPESIRSEEKIQCKIVVRDDNFVPYFVDWLALAQLWNENNTYFVYDTNTNIYRENWFVGNRGMFILGEIYFDAANKALAFKNGRYRTSVLAKHMNTIPIAIEKSALDIEAIRKALIRPIHFQESVEIPNLAICNDSPT